MPVAPYTHFFQILVNKTEPGRPKVISVGDSELPGEFLVTLKDEDGYYTERIYSFGYRRPSPEIS